MKLNKLYFPKEMLRALRDVDIFNIRILTRLYNLENKEGYVYITIDKLLEECGYCIEKDNRRKAKSVIISLCKEGIVSIEEMGTKANDLTIIRILKEDWLETEDLSLLFNRGIEVRKVNTLIRVYLCYVYHYGEDIKKMRKDLNMSIANFRDYIITLCKLNLIDEEICNKLEESKDVLNDALSSYECKFIEMLKKYNLEYKKEPLYRDYIKDCKDKKRFDFR